jgi:hypothetical protein
MKLPFESIRVTESGGHRGPPRPFDANYLWLSGCGGLRVAGLIQIDLKIDDRRLPSSEF